MNLREGKKKKILSVPINQFAMLLAEHFETRNPSSQIPNYSLNNFFFPTRNTVTKEKRVSYNSYIEEFFPSGKPLEESSVFNGAVTATAAALCDGVVDWVAGSSGFIFGFGVLDFSLGPWPLALQLRFRHLSCAAKRNLFLDNEFEKVQFSFHSLFEKIILCFEYKNHIPCTTIALKSNTQNPASIWFDMVIFFFHELIFFFHAHLENL